MADEVNIQTDQLVDEAREVSRGYSKTFADGLEERIFLQLADVADTLEKDTMDNIKSVVRQVAEISFQGGFACGVFYDRSK